MTCDSNRSIAIISRAKRPLFALARHRPALSWQKATAARRLGRPMIPYGCRLREISADPRHLPP